MGAAFRRVGMAVGLLTVAVVALGVASVKAFSEFSEELTKVETLVGVDAQLVRQFGEEIKNLAPAVGRGPAELARALFAITSGGERGVGALRLLQQAAKASAAGLGDTATIARTATASLQAFSAMGMTADRSIDILTATVREGNLEAADLAGSLGTAMGPAATMGVSMEELGAFVATYTRLGVDARVATTALRATMNTFMKPTTEAREALVKLGTSLETVREEIREKGLARVLIGLVDRAHELGVDIADVVPNVRALSGVLGSAGVQAEQYELILQSIINSQGMTDEAFKRTTQEVAFMARAFKAELQVALITIGETLAPVVMKMLEGMKQFTAYVRENADAVQQWVRGALVEAGKVIGHLGEKLVAVIEFFRTHSLAGEFGLLGLVFLGPLGLAAGVAIGGMLDTLIGKIVGPTTAMETHAKRIREAQEEINTLSELYEELRERGRKPTFEGLRNFLKGDVPESVREIYNATNDVNMILHALTLREQELRREIHLNSVSMVNFGDDSETAFEQSLAAAKEFFQWLQEGAPTAASNVRATTDAVTDLSNQLMFLGTGFMGIPIIMTMEEWARLSTEVAANTERVSTAYVALPGGMGLVLAAAEQLAHHAAVFGDNSERGLNIWEETEQNLEHMGEMIGNQLAGGLTTAIAQGQSLGKVFSQIGLTIQRELIGALIKAIIKATILKALMSSMGPFGGLFQHGGFVRGAQAGMMVPNYPGGAGTPIVAHAGEAVLTRRAVRSLGGAPQVHALNTGMAGQGGGGGAVSVSVDMNLDSLPDPSDYDIIATTPQIQRFMAAAMDRLKATGYSFGED